MAEDRQEPVLQLEQVVKKYAVSGKELTAVNGVSLTVQQGETVAIVGESGCGKSTLVRMVTGIELVTEGSIRVLGKELSSPEKRLSRQEWQELRRKMQLVLQNPSGAISPRMRIDRFLREPFINWRLCEKEQISSRIEELLHRVELDENVLHKFPHQLSGGELQRIVIARALAVSPSLLICDEPTSALDVSIQAQVIALLERLRTEQGMTILFVSHDIALMGKFADQIVVMYLGNIVEKLPASQLKNAVHPYTKALINAIFQPGKENVSVLEGDPPSPLDRPTGCPFYGRCPVYCPDCAIKSPELREYGRDHFVSCFLTK